MPQLGETVTEGTITRWFKQVGETVAADEPLFEVSTDKVDSEVPAPAAGVVSEILVAEGDTVDVGVRARGDLRLGRRRAPSAAAPAAAPEPAPAPAPAPVPRSDASRAGAAAGTRARAEAGAGLGTCRAGRPDPARRHAPTSADGGGAIVTSPLVRRMIAEQGLDPAQIRGTGEGGRITRNDVVEATQGPCARGAPPARDCCPQPPRKRAAPAQPAAAPARSRAPAPTRSFRSTTSGGAPPSTWCGRRRRARTCTRRCASTSSGSSARGAPNQAAWQAEEGFSLTYLPFIVRAFCDVVHDYPHVNASVDGDSLVVHRDLHLGIAVDLDFKGLVAPVIRNADGKRLRLIAREIRDLAARAKSKQLGPDEVVGGTFTITNMGPFGTTLTLPIINQPQVAIMATDGIRKEAGRGRRPRRRRHDRDPPRRHARARVGPPCVRRRVRGVVPERGARGARDPRLGRRARVTTPVTSASRLRVRWLGLVPYREAEALQRAIHERSDADYLLLQEHPHVYTLGSSADLAHVLRDPESVGAELVKADRGGDVTYHGPGQLVGYPIVSLAEWRAGQRDVVAYVRKLESVLIAVLADFGIEADVHPEVHRRVGRRREDRGDRRARRARPHPSRLRAQRRSRPHDVRAHRPVRHSRPWGHVDGAGARGPGRSYARDARGRRPGRRAVRRGVRCNGRSIAKTSRGALPRRISRRSRAPPSPDVPVRLLGRLAAAGVDEQVDPAARRPEWMKVRARFDDEYIELKRLVRDLDLHTVCEEAGCPNIYECWSDRTATFMILGDRCTRACGFCLVDTRKPLAVDLDEPRRVADAVRALGLAHVGDHLRRPRRPSRRRRVGLRGDGRRGARREPRHRGRVADLRREGRRRVARRDLRGATRRAEPQPRDGRAAAARGAPVGRLRPFALGARTGEERGPRHEVGPDPRHGRDGRRGASRRSPICGPSASTSSRSVSTCGRPRSTCRSRAGGRPTSSTRSGGMRRRWASRTSSPGRSCGPAITLGPESITWLVRRPDRLTAWANASRRSARSRRVVGGAADVLRRDRAQRGRRARQPVAQGARHACASSRRAVSRTST